MEENQKEKDAKKRAEAAAAGERSGLDANEEEYRSLPTAWTNPDYSDLSPRQYGRCAREYEPRKYCDRRSQRAVAGHVNREVFAESKQKLNAKFVRRGESTAEAKRCSSQTV